jgi:hypothetical protein
VPPRLDHRGVDDTSRLIAASRGQFERFMRSLSILGWQIGATGTAPRPRLLYALGIHRVHTRGRYRASRDSIDVLIFNQSISALLKSN